MTKEISISKFKATCLAVVEDVRRTGIPIRVTKFGKAMADVVAIRLHEPGEWLGCMAGSAEIAGDIEGSQGLQGDGIQDADGAFANWSVEPE